MFIVVNLCVMDDAWWLTGGKGSVVEGSRLLMDKGRGGGVRLCELDDGGVVVVVG